jgi:hypothetical protein
VYGGIQAAGGVKTVAVTKPLILAVRNASSRRREALKRKRDTQEEQEKAKRTMLKDLKSLELKRKALSDSVTSELDGIDVEIKTLKRKLNV